MSRFPIETFSEMERIAAHCGPLFRFKHHGAIFTIRTELVLEKLKFFQADRSRLDAGECEVASPVPSEAVAFFVKRVEGKPIAITDEDCTHLLLLSGEFGFQELSDACQAFADECLFQVAAEQRDASELCPESGVGAHQAWIRAAEFYCLSAEQGHAYGQYCFGRVLESGVGVAQDLVRAAEFYVLSAEQRHADAQYNFGRCLEFSRGVAQDLVRAAEFYRLSAEQGNARGQWHFGRCLEFSHGIVQDFFCAAELYRLAAERGIESGNITSPAAWNPALAFRAFDGSGVLLCSFCCSG